MDYFGFLKPELREGQGPGHWWVWVLCVDVSAEIRRNQLLVLVHVHQYRHSYCLCYYHIYRHHRFYLRTLKQTISSCLFYGLDLSSRQLGVEVVDLYSQFQPTSEYAD